MSLRKISLMHYLFGKASGFHICKECKHFEAFRYHTKNLKKCRVYGITASEASDWANKYEACGMFNKDWNGTPIIERARHRIFDKKEEEPIDGQISLMEESKNE